jgi:hypothetical protein
MIPKRKNEKIEAVRKKMNTLDVRKVLEMAGYALRYIEELG